MSEKKFSMSERSIVQHYCGGVAGLDVAKVFRLFTTLRRRAATYILISSFTFKLKPYISPESSLLLPIPLFFSLTLTHSFYTLFLSVSFSLSLSLSLSLTHSFYTLSLFLLLFISLSHSLILSLSPSISFSSLSLPTHITL